MHQLSENMLRVQFLIHGICLHNWFPVPFYLFVFLHLSFLLSFSILSVPTHLFHSSPIFSVSHSTGENPQSSGHTSISAKSIGFFPHSDNCNCTQSSAMSANRVRNEASMLTHAPHHVVLFRVFCICFQKGWVWKSLPRPRCRARTAEPEFFSEQGHMNLYLWCYIVPWTECNNRHKYYHNNPHNSEFMDILAG